MTSFFIQKPYRTTVLMALLAAIFLLSGGPAHAQDATANEKEQRIEDINEISKSMNIRYRQKKEKTTDAPIVVELFSAPDCSACIFGDRILFDAVKDQQVIGLTCLVKDIDNIDKTNVRTHYDSNKPIDICMLKLWAYETDIPGQQDTSISIPLFIVNGMTIVDTMQFQSFGNILEQFRLEETNSNLQALMRWSGKGTITISLPQKLDPNPISPASVWLIRYKNTHVEKMDHGVNKDRVLRFSNVVQYSQHIGKWYGEPRDIVVNVPLPQGGAEAGGYAVIVKTMIAGKILTAGKLEDYPL